MSLNYPTHNGKTKLKHRNYTLADVVDELIDLKDRLIRKISAEKLSTLTHQSEFDLEPPFVIIQVYKTFQDKENNAIIYLIFANHGQVPFCHGEVLESYSLNTPDFFWDFKIHPDQPHHYQFAENYIFSDDDDAHPHWSASLNYDEIFNYCSLDGSEDLAGFAGFFWVE